MFCIGDFKIINHAAVFWTWTSGNRGLMWAFLPANAFMNPSSWPLELLMWPGDIALQAGNRKFVMDYSLQFKLLTLFNPLVGLPSPPARHAAAALIGSVPALPDSPPSLTEVLSGVGAREESGALVFRLWSISSSFPPKKKNQMSFLLRSKNNKCITLLRCVPFWHQSESNQR